jgi:hypothetical protein
MDFLQRETGQHWMRALMMLSIDYKFNLDFIQFNLKNDFSNDFSNEGPRLNGHPAAVNPVANQR